MRRKYKRFLKAAYIDYSEDYCSSGPSTFTKPTVTTPIIVITGNTAIIACAVSGVTIYYTLDGSTPTSSSTEYTGAITLTLSCTIKAIAVKPGMTDSEVASESYVHYLTQWKIVGNSQVHTDPFLTSWKVSGNSEVHTLPYPDGIVLPNGYKRCEYLESDGTAYIELPIALSSQSDSVVIKAAIKTVTDWKGFIAPKTWIATENKRFVMGSCVSKDNKHLWSPALGSYGQGNIFFTPELEADTDVHTWSYNNNTFTIDDIYTSKLNSGTFTTDNLRIFYGYNTPFASKICDYHHIKADAEYHLIPCLDSNDTPCMYDVINNQTYYNSASSGSFTYKLYPQPAEIWSCGDYSDVDGKYHVKISNGVDIYDIALDEPLRKVNDVADTIEFPSETEGKALVTRNLGGDKLGNFTWNASNTSNNSSIKRWNTKALKGVISTSSVILTIEYTKGNTWNRIDKTYSCDSNDFFIYDKDYNTEDSYNDFIAHINNYDIIYELATPTTDLIDVSPFPVSPTDTYTSANVIPYSAFEHTENKEIWSCGEYSEVDGKYHILVQPLGGSIVDIALTEPLRKVNDVADTIEFPSGTEGKALVTRKFNHFDMGEVSYDKINTPTTYFRTAVSDVKYPSAEALCAVYPTYPYTTPLQHIHLGLRVGLNSAYLFFINDDQAELITSEFKDANAGIEVIYELVTPTTELIDAPQIQEAESYTCIISQGGKAVEWSSFETE